MVAEADGKCETFAPPLLIFLRFKSFYSNLVLYSSLSFMQYSADLILRTTLSKTAYLESSIRFYLGYIIV